jgi:hypothetical protein
MPQSGTLPLTDRLRQLAIARGDQFLAELPATLRRLRLVLLVLSISVPTFLLGCLALLAWRLLG